MAKDPAGFAIYGSGQWTIPEGYAAQKFMKGGLANNHIEPNARLCMASAVTGYLSVYGVDEPAGCYDDLDRADVVVLWGNNPAEMHPVLFSRLIERRTRGERITLIDLGTRRTRTTEHADRLPRVPAPTATWPSPTASPTCCSRTTAGTATSSPSTATSAATTTRSTSTARRSPSTSTARRSSPTRPSTSRSSPGVPAAKIRMLAELFGRRDLRITSLWCMGMNQHTRGTAINRLVHSIHLLSGHFGRPGDAPTSSPASPPPAAPPARSARMCNFLPGGRLVANAEHRKEAEEIWNLPAGRINPKPGYHTVQLFEKFCTPTDKGGDIDTIWVQVTNPGQTLPDLARTFTGKRNLADKFLIVSDVYPTATTAIADLVLPAALWVEKNGMYGNSERRTQQWFKMVNPPGEARDDCWQTIAVARRLFDLGHPAMKDKDGNFLFHVVDPRGKPVPIWDWAHYYDVNVDEQLFNEYRTFSRKKHKDLAPYDEYVKARGLRWPVVQQADGSWRETKFRFSEFDDSYVKKGAEIQFYHSVTKDDRPDLVLRIRTRHRGTRSQLPTLALHRPRARALAHRHDDHAHPPAARRHAPGLRRDEPRGRRRRSASQNGDLVRPRDPPRQARAAGLDRGPGPARGRAPCSCRSSTRRSRSTWRRSRPTIRCRSSPTTRSAPR